MNDKPLFIPLRTQWFREFEAGTKGAEYRAYGARWNEHTCRVGRKATISHGYSGKRLYRVVAAFEVVPWAQAPASARAIYPDAELIAAIHIPAPSRQESHCGETDCTYQDGWCKCGLEG